MQLLFLALHLLPQLLLVLVDPDEMLLQARNESLTKLRIVLLHALLLGLLPHLQQQRQQHLVVRLLVRGVRRRTFRRRVRLELLDKG